MTPDPKTTSSSSSPEGAEDDVQSDPAKGAEDRSDWTDEGGAPPEGSS